MLIWKVSLRYVFWSVRKSGAPNCFKAEQRTMRRDYTET